MDRAYVAVPAEGELEVGTIYRRRDIHRRFGGNRQAGIVPCKRDKIVFLFHTFEPSQQFYRDGIDEDGIYWYSGEGVTGDMGWTSANLALRDHEENGAQLWLFERAQRRGGLWRFKQKMRYLGHRYVKRIDKGGQARRTIVFGLLPAKERHRLS